MLCIIPEHGEAKVINVDGSCVHIDKDNTGWTNHKMLSFKPWPAPCHERPVEDGVWIVGDPGMKEVKTPFIRRYEDGLWWATNLELRKIGVGYQKDNYTLIQRIAD